jgi:hypothetical protein
MCIKKAENLTNQIISTVKKTSGTPECAELKLFILNWIYDKTIHIIDIIFDIIELLGLDYKEYFKILYRLFKVYSAENI